jgi:hypothetical protein
MRDSQESSQSQKDKEGKSMTVEVVHRPGIGYIGEVWRGDSGHRLHVTSSKATRAEAQTAAEAWAKEFQKSPKRVEEVRK